MAREVPILLPHTEISNSVMSCFRPQTNDKPDMFLHTFSVYLLLKLASYIRSHSGNKSTTVTACGFSREYRMTTRVTDVFLLQERRMAHVQPLIATQDVLRIKEQTRFLNQFVPLHSI